MIDEQAGSELNLMDENLHSKRYEPPIIDLDNKNSSHTLIIESTGFNKTVLEIGTSTGYISKILTEHGNHVTGIEIDREAGLRAQKYCERIIIGDVEVLDLDEYFTAASFDVIVCGDVLEHLIKPGTLLVRLRKYLKHDGYLVVSLPNFCHGDVILNILNGDFHYTSIGLLDETHLRFFGLKNIISKFSDSGYQITDIHTINYGIGTTELKMDTVKIPGDLLKFINSLPDSTVYQYVFKAIPSDKITQPVPVNQFFSSVFSQSVHDYQQELRTTLIAEIEDLRSHYSAMTAQRDERDTRIQQLTDERDQLRVHYDAMTAQHDERDARIRQLTDERDQLQIHLGSETTQREERDARILQLTADLEKFAGSPAYRMLIKIKKILSYIRH